MSEMIELPRAVFLLSVLLAYLFGSGALLRLLRWLWSLRLPPSQRVRDYYRDLAEQIDPLRASMRTYQFAEVLRRVIYQAQSLHGYSLRANPAGNEFGEPDKLYNYYLSHLRRVVALSIEDLAEASGEYDL